MSKALKLCPFCGKKVKLVDLSCTYRAAFVSDYRGFYVGCYSKRCTEKFGHSKKGDGIETKVFTKAIKAINAWNNRTSPKPRENK